MEPDFEAVVHYGQLLDIFVIHLPSSPVLHLETDTTLILACIKQYRIPRNQHLTPLNIQYHTPQDSLLVEVVDLQTLSAVIGRVQLGNTTYLIDRSGVAVDAEYVD